MVSLALESRVQSRPSLTRYGFVAFSFLSVHVFGNGSNRLNISIKIINLNQIESEITLDLVKHVTVLALLLYCYLLC